MKLGKIWKYFDAIQDYIIWYADNPDEKFKSKEGVMYEGCPKKLKNYYLIDESDNEGSEAISPYTYESKYGAKLIGMRFTVVKEK